MKAALLGLGADYLAEFEAVMARICAMPEMLSAWSPNSGIRKAGFKRFPFHMIYRAEPRGGSSFSPSRTNVVAPPIGPDASGGERGASAGTGADHRRECGGDSGGVRMADAVC